MAISTANGVTTLTPTAWKWFVGAAFIFFLVPPFSMLISLFFVLTGAGVMQRLTLTKDELVVRQWFSEKRYAWNDIQEFRVQKIKSGLITAANMIAFTHVNKEGTMMGKAAKLLAGGTHSIPAVGMPTKKLALLMQAYKSGHVPADTADVTVTAPTPAPVAARPAPARPRAVPATPRAAQHKPAAFGKTKRPAKQSTPLVQDGGGLFGRRRPSSPFNS